MDKWDARTRSPGPPSPEGPAQRHVPRTHARAPPAPHTHTAGDAREQEEDLQRCWPGWRGRPRGAGAAAPHRAYHRRMRTSMGYCHSAHTRHRGEHTRQHATTLHTHAPCRGGEGDRGVQGGVWGWEEHGGGGRTRVNGLWGVGGSENTKTDFSGDSTIGGRESTLGAQEDDG